MVYVMAAPVKQRALIYLEKNRLDYIDEKIGNTLKLDFPASVLSDLEIINKEEFIKLLDAFISANKLVSSVFLVIVSNNLVFEKNFTQIDETNKENEIHNYLDNVPFEEIGYKVFNQEKGIKIIAFNKEIYDIVRFVFESHNFFANGAVTENMADGTLASAHTLNTQSFKEILTKFDILRQQSLLGYDAPMYSNQSSSAPQSLSTFKKPKSYLIILLGVFVFLIGVLIFVFIQSNKPLPKTKIQPTSAPLAAPTALPTPTNVLLPTSISSPSAIPNISVPASPSAKITP